MLRFFAATSLILLVFLKPINALAAGDFVEDQSGSSSNAAGESGDSTFDPFSDYSEFDEGSQEEADINFFHNGRFFTIGVLGGYESFTQTLGIIYQPSFHFGVFIDYFFDLKLAMQLGYGTASHAYNLQTGTNTVNGSVQLNHFEFAMKYYLNTQNVTKGLAGLNPYLIGGGAYYTRQENYSTINNVAVSASVSDSAVGIEAGIGIEIPIMHNNAFFGIQGTYNYIGFSNANSQITINSVPQGLTPNGGSINLDGILGISF